MTDPTAMTNEDFTRHMLPSQDDMATAASWLAAQAQMDPTGLLAIYTDTAQRGRLFQLVVAISETAVQATGLRDNPDALPALLADLLTAAGDHPEGGTHD